jgi:hypothetical protein
MVGSLVRASSPFRGYPCASCKPTFPSSVVVNEPSHADLVLQLGLVPPFPAPAGLSLSMQLEQIAGAMHALYEHVYDQFGSIGARLSALEGGVGKKLLESQGVTLGMVKDLSWDVVSSPCSNV